MVISAVVIPGEEFVSDKGVVYTSLIDVATGGMFKVSSPKRLGLPKGQLTRVELEASPRMFGNNLGLNVSEVRIIGASANGVMPVAEAASA